MDRKLSRVYYSPKGFWKGLGAVKKLAEEARVPEDVTKLWLMRQAIWQIYLPAPKHIPRPTFDVDFPNAVHQADLLFLPHKRKELIALVKSQPNPEPRQIERISAELPQIPKRVKPMD